MARPSIQPGQTTPPTGNSFTLTANGTPLYQTNVVNGHPVVRFDTGNDFFSRGTTTLASYITNSAYTVFVVFSTSGVNTNAANTYENDALVSDTGGYFGVFLKSAITGHAYNWDGSDDQVSQSVTVSTWTLLATRHEGGNLYIRKNNGSDSSVASGNTEALTGEITVGRSISGARGFLPRRHRRSNHLQLRAQLFGSNNCSKLPGIEVCALLALVQFTEKG